MAIIETTTRQIPCDTPNDAATLVVDYADAMSTGTLMRVENEDVAEYVNPNQIVGITDGTLA